jgi:hypothetical protein
MPAKNRAKVCKIPGCGRPHAAKGYCWAHYMRVRRNNAPGRAKIAPQSDSTVRCEVWLPLKVWERLAGQGAPFSELARELLGAAAKKLPTPPFPPRRGDRAKRARLTEAEALSELERVIGAVFPPGNETGKPPTA